MTDYRMTLTLSITLTEQDGSADQSVEIAQNIVQELIDAHTAFDDTMIGLYHVEPIGEETSRPRFRKIPDGE